ncbi:MAG: 50S ribosomal protein L14, partial [Blastochloris sp.]|nr:50S ribosomal protein L14 [Blastochloris sp.]
MIQNECDVDVADNTGAKVAMVFHVCGGSTAK